MKIRPVDRDGDMMPIQYTDQLLDDADAVAQLVRDRISLLYGEWWEDEEIGFRIPEMFISNVRRGHVGMLEQYVSQYIAGTAGVQKVSNIQVTFENHKLTYSCRVTAGSGSAEVEVDLSGLL